MLSKQASIYLLVLASKALAMDIDPSNKESINSGLAKIAKGLMDYYNGDQPGNTVGKFQPPYYWWESGAAWGSLVDYWYYTGDTKYNERLVAGLLAQAGPNNDYMPVEENKSEGNDDQGYWGVTLMGAAEKGLVNLHRDGLSWSKLAQNIVDSMISRWDTDNCGGGLRWQIYPWNKGYDYKNTVSNGCLFHLSARLSRFNNDDKYVEWAEKSWDWMEEHNYILTNVTGYKIFDGASIASGCTEISPEQWTYNAGLILSGAAYMYDYTKDSKWLDRAKHVWEGSSVFFKDSAIMYEPSCQLSNRCNNDQRSFKAYFSRFLGLTSLLLPDLSDSITERLKSSATGALASCSGGSDGHTCGLDWTKGSWDGNYGLGEQMTALEVLQNAYLVKSKPGPANKSNVGSIESSNDSGLSNWENSNRESSSQPKASQSSQETSSARTVQSAQPSTQQVQEQPIGQQAQQAKQQSDNQIQQQPKNQGQQQQSENQKPSASFSNIAAGAPNAFTQDKLAGPYASAQTSSHVTVTHYTDDPGAQHTTVTVYTNSKGAIVATASGSHFIPHAVTSTPVNLAVSQGAPELKHDF